MSYFIRYTCLAGVIVAATMQPVFAADKGVYLGAGVARSSIDATGAALSNLISSARVDDSGNGFKVIGGLRLRDWLGVEASYMDFDKVTAPTTEYGLKGVDAFGVFFLSAPFVDVFAKVGGIYWEGRGGADARYCTNPVFGSTSLCTTQHPVIENSGFDLAYGTGVQARLRSLGVRLEYEQFNVKDADKVSAVSLSVTWTFL
jgi:Outer membrane protein beta-barrel domain